MLVSNSHVSVHLSTCLKLCHGADFGVAMNGLELVCTEGESWHAKCMCLFICLSLCLAFTLSMCLKPCHVAGSWVLVDGPELSWTEGDRWHAKIELPSATIYEYKYVLLDSSGTNALTWQRGNNSVLAIKQVCCRNHIKGDRLQER